MDLAAKHKSSLYFAENLYMRQFKFRISLRYKLLFLLTALPIASLALYLVIATNLFKEDKVAYVFDSSAAVSRSLATQMRTELQAAYSSLRTIVEHYDFNQRAFSAVAQELFAKNQKAHALLLFKREANGQYTKLGEMLKPSVQAKAFAENTIRLVQLRDQALANTLALSENHEIEGAVNLSFRLGEKEDADHMIIMALYQAEDMVDAFAGTGLYKSLVVTRAGTLALGSSEKADSEMATWKSILQSKAGEGATETKFNDGETYLVSFAGVGLGDLTVISRVNKSKALKAVDVLIEKSLLFFIALLAFTLLISVFASAQLTSSLRELFEATQKIGQGDFAVRVKSRSNDEVGGLADSFNTMAAEVSRLMTETAEKARMQSELATVSAVQETLFPKPEAQFGALHIKGHFEPASECGGDWWNYSRVGNKIYLWIGDATGHGAPAALITSAARSAAAVIETMPNMTPSNALSIMNRAIHQTSKGQIMMTFFLAAIDLDAQTLSYACASHDPPYMLRANGSKMSKRDLIPLNDVNGPRLGDQKTFEYTEHSMPFGPGDMVVFYTDGILDVENPLGKKWGERAFLKSIVDVANLEAGANGKVESLMENVNQFRAASALADDVTLVICKFEDAKQMAA